MAHGNATMDKITYGFLPEETQPDHWSLGSGKATQRFGATQLMKDGHGWGKFIPKKEIQRRGSLETQACTIFGSANCWETLANFYGYKDFPRDLAERYNGVLAEIGPQGGFPHKSCETFRLYGGLNEELLPFSEDIRSWEHFYHPNPMEESYIKVGQDLLRKYKLGHEWVFNGPTIGWQDKLKHALSRGTVAISVSAWHEKNGRYYDEGQPNNHWLQLVDYKEGKYWIVNDHYEPTEKKLDWNHNIYCAKLYFLSPNYDGLIPTESNYFMYLIQKLWQSLLKYKQSLMGLFTK